MKSTLKKSRSYKSTAFLVVVFFSILFIACGSDETEAVQIEQTEAAALVPETRKQDVTDPSLASDPAFVVDTAKILTIEDFIAVKSRAFDAFVAHKTSAFDAYVKAKSVAWEEYSKKEKAALEQVRALHQERYFEWLDAEKMNDYSKKSEIENSPEFAEYKRASSAAYEIYEAANTAAYAVYDKIHVDAYALYDKAHVAAYAAYDRHK